MATTSEPSDEATLIGGEETSASMSASISSSTLSRGTSVGRYVVIDRLGAGGMGVVYRAIDPQLERMVALKLLRFGEHDDVASQHARLLREAQALARVRHPNVVTVHDVGVEDGRVHVAMELIEGQTLGQWLRAEPRAWARVLEVFVQAGRGLAAAHEERLVHRDFKPDNVMLTDRGRVVVMDFGLARGNDPSPDSEPDRIEGPENLLLSTEITRVGTLVGTPAYMSPEQLAGRSADLRSDQFAFCVALFEGLYGERPYQADGVMALVLAITNGQMTEPPASVRVPGWLDRIVRRGLRSEPADRWPSMDALLDALTDPPSRRRRRRLLQGGAVLGVGVTLALAVAWAQRPDERCTGAQERLSGTWDPARHEQVLAAAAALELPWADPGVTAAVTELDEYATQWAAGHTEACRATVIHGSQSQEAMDLRVACLERARLDLEAAAQLLVNMDAEVAEHARELSRGLPPLSVCADLEGLRAEVPPPGDPATREDLDELQRELARVRSAERAGKYNDAAELLEPLDARAEAIGYTPVHAEYLLARGRNEDDLGRYPQARATLEQALELGLASSLPRVALSSAMQLGLVIGQGERRPAEALIYARIAIGLAKRPGIGPNAEAEAYGTYGSVQLEAGLPAEAEASLRKALELDIGTDPLRTGRLENGLGLAIEGQSRREEALAHQLRAFELAEGTLGSGHPSLLSLHNGLANTLIGLDRFEEAEAHHRTALGLSEAAFGPDNPLVAMSHFNLGTVLSLTDRDEQAEVEIRSALEIVERSMGADHARAGMIHGNLATVLLRLDRNAEVETHARRAVEILERTLGPDHIETATPRSLLGLALERQERLVESAAEQAKALAAREQALAPEHDSVVLSLVRLGRVERKLGHHPEAIDLLERAIEGEARRDPPGTSRTGDARFELGRALWEANADRARAVALVRQSVGELDAHEDLQHEAQQWLREHSLGDL